MPDTPAAGPPPVSIEFGSLEDRTKLPGCHKLYVPLGEDGAVEAPTDSCSSLSRSRDDSLAWNLIAFGERHPANERTRNVYERAHKRLHGRYP